MGHPLVAKCPNGASGPLPSKVATMDVLSQDHVVTLCGKFHGAMLGSAKLVPPGHLGYPTAPWWLHVDDTLRCYRGYAAKNKGKATNNPPTPHNLPATAYAKWLWPQQNVGVVAPVCLLWPAGGQALTWQSLMVQYRLCSHSPLQQPRPLQAASPAAQAASPTANSLASYPPSSPTHCKQPCQLPTYPRICPLRPCQPPTDLVSPTAKDAD